MHLIVETVGAACGGLAFTPEGVAAFLALAGVAVAGVGAVALQVLRVSHDVQAAWRLLRAHDAALNGATKAPGKDGGT